MNLIFSLASLLLSFYPSSWREQFSEQILFDLHQQHDEGTLTSWGMLRACWDLIKQLLPAHAHAKEQSIVLASTSGYSNKINYPQMYINIFNSVPQTLVLGGLLFFSLVVVGVGLYDTWMFGRVGLMGAAVFFPLLWFAYRRVQKLEFLHSKTATAQLSKNILFVFIGCTFALFSMQLYTALSDYGSFKADMSLAQGITSITGMPPQFLSVLVAVILVLSVLGSSLYSKRSIRWPVVLAATVLYLAAILVWSLPAVPFFVVYLALVVPFLLRPSISDSLAFGFTAVFSMGLYALFFGFLFGMILDFSQPAERLSKNPLTRPVHSTLNDYAQQYKTAHLNIHTHGKQQFIEYLRASQDKSIAWRSHKPWTRLYTPVPPGIYAKSWCLTDMDPKNPNPVLSKCSSVGQHWLTVDKLQ